MSGGKGGSQTSKVEIPKWLEEPSKRAIARGEDISKIDYIPWMGPDVAAFSPTQEAAFNNTNSAASAFGMDASTGTGMPPPSDFGGVSGYSSYPILNDAVYESRQANPKQFRMRDNLFDANSSLGKSLTGQELDPNAPFSRIAGGFGGKGG